MRDSIGGTFLITILMVFIVLFVSFTAVIVNVAKTFRVKNGIINIIEQESGINGAELDAAKSEIDSYLASASYNAASVSGAQSSCDGEWQGSYGYCLKSMDGGKYYKVTVYVYIQLPFFNLDFTIPISGETSSYQTLGS